MVVHAVNIPSGLRIKSGIVTKGLFKSVSPTNQARHLVEVSNRSLLPYTISIHGECETPYVRYGDDARRDKTWDPAQFIIAPRPGHGGCTRRDASEKLTSLGKSENESIRTDLSYVPVTWSRGGSESVYVQVVTK